MKDYNKGRKNERKHRGSLWKRKYQMRSKASGERERRAGKENAAFTHATASRENERTERNGAKERRSKAHTTAEKESVYTTPKKKETEKLALIVLNAGVRGASVCVCVQGKTKITQQAPIPERKCRRRQPSGNRGG